MSRETVRMVREGRRPVVVEDEPDRDELLARIAALELDLRIANRALRRLLEPKVGDGREDLGYFSWVEGDDDGEEGEEDYVS